ncbi:patr class I histocompatibility antigen, B-2 alpha chain-like isoform X2 [Salvelinus alpinus]|uniref:patr class I histocompatibility antigen, B-2 alpha chain-like isoform X2 n=1 Tax=Salvelinus alpinus TaxID=8036 RepID=UPI0039FD13F4
MMNPIRYVFIGLLLCSFISQNDVGPTLKHVLEYTYTRFNSSHYEVAGLFNGELVDFYSSALKSPVPTKSWNEKNPSFGNTVWQKSISARQHVNTYFLSSAVDLKRHFVKHALGGDIVQMKLGCTESKETEKNVGFAEFAYDGNTVLLLSESSTAPKVYTVPSGSLKPGLINLTCLITGSYPKSSPIEMNLFRDNILLTEMEGVHSSGVRPNEDHTYQLRKTVRINASESVVYRCDVNHESFPKPRNYTWEVKKQEGSNLLIYIGLCIFFVCLLAAVPFFKNRLRSARNGHLAANLGENAALGVQDEGSLIDQGGDATSVDLSTERDVLTNASNAEGENDEAYGSRGSSDSDLSQIQRT